MPKNKWKALVYLISMFGAFFVYNLYSPPSLAVSIGFHCLLFGWCLVAFSRSMFSTLRKGPEVGRRHAQSRFWATIVINVVGAIGCIWLGTLLTEDAIDPNSTGYATGTFLVKHNQINFYGHWLLQQPDLEELNARTKFTGRYFFRWNLMRDDTVYRVTYGARSHFMYMAAPVARLQR